MPVTKSRITERLIIALVMVLAWATNANADVIKLSFGNVFSGVAAAGAVPWLTATFTDIAAAPPVRAVDQDRSGLPPTSSRSVAPATAVG